jgi:hypothetical protein
MNTRGDMLSTVLVAVLASLVMCIVVASIGRTGDWAPFALVLAGWLLGGATTIAVHDLYIEMHNRADPRR